jgi:hypothetical protein
MVHVLRMGHPRCTVGAWVRFGPSDSSQLVVVAVAASLPHKACVFGTVRLADPLYVHAGGLIRWSRHRPAAPAAVVRNALMSWAGSSYLMPLLLTLGALEDKDPRRGDLASWQQPSHQQRGRCYCGRATYAELGWVKQRKFLKAQSHSCCGLLP